MRTDPLDTGKVDWIYSGNLADRGYTAADLNVLARILSRPCPTCNANAGRWCHTANGQSIQHLDEQHAARRRQGVGW